MSLRINSNTSAMSALRQLSLNDAKMAKAITRLSTGLRINSAGDDPSGLIISEGLRAQIRGLDQAMRNAQDAVTMIKTAEAAMNEVQTLLLNIRAIAVHAANSAVVDATQLLADQSQINSTLASIDRIAEQTAWGTKKLLNGSAGADASITRTDLVTSMQIQSEFGGEIVADGDINITRTTAATQTTTGALATTFASTTSTVNAGTFALNGVAFTVDAGATLSDVVAMINQKSADTGVVAAITGTVPNLAVSLSATEYGSNFDVEYLETTNILNGGAGATATQGVDAVFVVELPVKGGGTQTETFTGGQGPGVDGLSLTSSSGNRMTISVAGNATAAQTLVGQLSVGTLEFQIGPNADQTSSFSISSLFASDLGTSAVPGQSLATLDVTTAQGAQDAIAIIDDAIGNLALLRGDLGSFQKNFLESTVRSLGVATENMTASESQIRDANIAQEMTEFTKIQILRQSGMAVLAQASKAPQDVLRLLQ